MTTRSTQRELLGLNQEQAALRAGVSVATWRRWERNPGSVGKDSREKCETTLTGRNLEDELWDDLQRSVDLLSPERLGPLGLTGASIDANVHLLDICCELFVANMKPTSHLRNRFGSAVMLAKMCEVLADGKTYEDATAAVGALFGQLRSARQHQEPTDSGMPDDEEESS